MLGVPPSRGRVLTDADNQHVGGHPVAVISNAFWRGTFAADPAIVGRGFTINGVAFTIVGVSAPGFSGVWLESPVDVWIPLAMQGDVRYAQNYSNDDADPSSPFYGMVVGKVQLGLFYADRTELAPEGVPPDETALIKALKGQVLAALAP